MSPMLISAIIGFALMVLTLGQVAPSISQMIYAKKVEIGIGREEALMQQVIRYRAIEGVYPVTMADMVTKSYWRTADNDNGLGGSYTFTTDNTKGLIAISTTIADATQRAQYLNNYRHVYRPVDVGGGVVTTTFVMPTAMSMGAPIPLTGSIPVASTAPSAASNTWWYDTSGSVAVLNVSDGVTWKPATPQNGGPTPQNIVASTAGLPATGANGDVRYVYNSATGAMSSYVWYGSSWVAYGSGGASTGSSSIPSLVSASRFAFLSDYVVNALACTWNDGVMALDGQGNYYACSDPDINGGSLPTSTCANVGRFTYDTAGNTYECVP